MRDSGEVGVRPVVRLGDVADVLAGDPAPQDPEAFAPDGPLFVRMQDVGRAHLNPALSDSVDRLDSTWLGRNRLRLFPKDSVLIPKSGVSVNLNHRAKLATDAYVVSHLAVVVPDRTKLDPDYLFWWSVRYDPRAQVQVTSLPSLKLATLKDAGIRLLPLGEQRRIAGILNRAARIERLRARAAARLDSFAPALFASMFGDPADNPMGWPIVRLDELCKMDRQGLQPDDPAAARLPFLGVENVIGGTGSLNLDADSRVGNKRSMSFRFDGRHVLYAKLRPYLNKVATPGFTGRCSTELIPLLPHKGVNGDFLAHLLRHKETVAFVMKSVTGARMPRTDMKVLMSMLVPCPPADVQNLFTEIVKQADSIADYAVSASYTASTLTASLMDRLLDGNPAR